MGLVVSRARLLGFLSVIALLAVAIFGSSAQAGTTLPPGGTFTDDDGNTHEGMIEAIAAIGVTQGCNVEGTLYCPDDFVSRAQMASFLARALSLPDATQDWFTDDDGNTHEDNINKIAEAGVTLGIGNGLYDPDGFVTRAQMASFLARALELPDSVTDWFTDDDGDTHEDNINKIADDGITLGCDDQGNYCPRDNVRRDQMASFIGRALGLTEIIPPPPTTTTTTTAATTTTTTMSTTTTTSGSTTHFVTANADNTFTPASVVVDEGDQVQWSNAGGFHNVVFDGMEYPGSGAASSGSWTYTETFDDAGVYMYYCDIHGGDRKSVV